jgi:signal transduction histidine kinase
VRGWASARKEHLAYAFAGFLLVVMLGCGIAGGMLLRQSANAQRQTFRLHDLATAASRGSGVDAALARVAAHDAAAATRLRSAGPEALRAGVDAELDRLERQQRDTYPVARIVLGAAALASLLLVATLVWLFERHRRAGRIDRDNAERARELARLRHELVGIVSHELRTPLTSILGFIDLISDEDSGQLTPEQREYFDVVKRNANRLLYLVSDLLLVAEADDGKLRLDLQDVDLDPLLRDSVEAARVAADRKRIDLKLASMPARLRGDPLRLAQAVDNLVSNAIKFTPEGGSVSVSSSARAADVVIEVRDSGVGIAPRDLEQIFERFFRAGAATGAGLGLAITKAIVDAHGGSIAVDSALGVGTTFAIVLPLPDELEPVPPGVGGVEAAHSR